MSRAEPDPATASRTRALAELKRPGASVSDAGLTHTRLELHNPVDLESIDEATERAHCQAAAHARGVGSRKSQWQVSSLWKTGGHKIVLLRMTQAGRCSYMAFENTDASIPASTSRSESPIFKSGLMVAEWTNHPTYFQPPAEC